MAHNNRKYHLEMMLIELRNFKFPNLLDTRNYLGVDETERSILTILIQSELDNINKE